MMLRWTGILALSTFACLSVITYRRGEVSTHSLPVEEFSFIGPKGEPLRAQAELGLRNALKSLEGTGNSQMANYTTQLERSRELLRFAVRASVVDGRAMQSLSVTDLELGAVRGPYQSDDYGHLLEVARGSRAHDGSFQVDIASTYLRIGRSDSALVILHDVVAANPSFGRRAVTLLDESGIDPRRIVTALGDSPEVLYALESPFAARNLTDSFVDEVARTVPTATGEVIDFFGDVCERSHLWPRALETLLPLTRLRDQEADAARLAVLARATLALGDSERAWTYAGDAARKSPQNPRYQELLADCSTATNRSDDALESLKRSLSSAIAGVTSAGQRARLYRKMGEIYERKGEGDRAYDAYRRSLDLVPEDPVALQRFRHITHEQVPSE